MHLRVRWKTDTCHRITARFKIGLGGILYRSLSGYNIAVFGVWQCCMKTCTGHGTEQRRQSESFSCFICTWDRSLNKHHVYEFRHLGTYARANLLHIFRPFIKPLSLRNLSSGNMHKPGYGDVSFFYDLSDTHKCYVTWNCVTLV